MSETDTEPETGGEESNSPPDLGPGGVLIGCGLIAFVVVVAWDFFGWLIGNPNNWLFALVGLMLICGSLLVQGERSLS